MNSKELKEPTREIRVFNLLEKITRVSNFGCTFKISFCIKMGCRSVAIEKQVDNWNNCLDDHWWIDLDKIHYFDYAYINDPREHYLSELETQFDHILEQIANIVKIEDLRKSALAKLTPEEKKALGIRTL